MTPHLIQLCGMCDSGAGCGLGIPYYGRRADYVSGVGRDGQFRLHQTQRPVDSMFTGGQKQRLCGPASALLGIGTTLTASTSWALMQTGAQSMLTTPILDADTSGLVFGLKRCTRSQKRCPLFVHTGSFASFQVCSTTLPCVSPALSSDSTFEGDGNPYSLRARHNVGSTASGVGDEGRRWFRFNDSILDGFRPRTRMG